MDKRYILIQCLICFLCFNICLGYAAITIELYKTSSYSALNYRSKTCIGKDMKNMTIYTKHKKSEYTAYEPRRKINGITSATLLNLNNTNISYPLICQKDESDDLICDFQPDDKMVLGMYAFHVEDQTFSQFVILKRTTSETNFTVSDPYTEFPIAHRYTLLEFSNDEKVINIDTDFKTEIKDQRLHKFILDGKNVECKIKDNHIVRCPFTKESFNSTEGSYKGEFYNPCGELVCDITVNVKIINGNKYGDSMPIYLQIIFLVGGIALIGAIIVGGIFLYKYLKKKKQINNVPEDIYNDDEQKEDEHDQKGIGLTNLL